MSYQGHHSDGSSVQKHSAGSHYPFIVGKQEGQLRPWFVMAPNGKMVRFHEAAVAFETAEFLAARRRAKMEIASSRIFVASTGESVSVPLNVQPAEKAAVASITA